MRQSKHVVESLQREREEYASRAKLQKPGTLERQRADMLVTQLDAQIQRYTEDAPKTVQEPFVAQETRFVVPEQAAPKRGRPRNDRAA